ncbi:Cullin repeat-like-containing domain protein [Gongronella butleri]|nr:Cullin repeat-like-containing domain protein [Gongronella butleri]
MASSASSLMLNRIKANAGTIDDDTDVNDLDNQLQKMNALSSKLSGILDSFDGRLLKLEASILPIHRSTQNLTRLASNIDDTLQVTDHIVQCLNMPSKEEGFILKGPDENDILPYLQAMGRLKDAVDTIDKSQLKSCEKAISQTKQLLKAGMLHLETLFRKWLTEVSSPIDSHALMEVEEIMPSSSAMKQLSQLATYIDTSVTEIGYTVDFTKPYADIRSEYMQKSLIPLCQSVQISEKHQGLSYEKGSSEFLKYMECFLKMVKSECIFAKKILSNASQRSAALKATIQPSLVEFASAGRQLVAIAKRLPYNESVFVFDILEKYERDCVATWKQILAENSLDLPDMVDLMQQVIVTAIKGIHDFVEDVKGRRDAGLMINLSTDGTVNEMTSNALNYLKRIFIWRDMVEPLLIFIGDGGWNKPVSGTDVAYDKIKFGEATSMGEALLQKFLVDSLDQLCNSLQSKSRGYKKPALATIFLLNNYNYILRQIRSPPLNAIFDEATEVKFGKLVKKQLDAYQESWKPCVENLMDVTYVRGGTIKNALSNADRQMIKDKFKNFNMEFDEIWRTQTAYAVPDLDLRNQMIRDVKNVIVPMYGRFLDKYQNADFTKNHAKYIKYDKEKLEKLISKLFEPTA